MIISTSKFHIDQTVTPRAKVFQVKDFGNMIKFLGINIERNSDGIHINQGDEVDALCEDMGMPYCNSACTLIADNNLIDSDITQSCSESEAIKYQPVVGSLLYIANMIRPDIQYAVNWLSGYVRMSGIGHDSLRH